ncbi:CU044_5270 family protein [Streptomyces flavovirens]|uniref:CU044_5270 family protein n=1 Tax=Streptomyces flavovirens TaxID=52258 RepID=UPI003D0B7769
MDDVTALREFGAGAPGPSDEARAAARARLARAVAEEVRRSRSAAPPRRLVLRAGIAATAAAAVTGALVVAPPGGDSGIGRDEDTPRMTTLSAAQVLHRAADRSRSEASGLPVPRDDQYFYTKEITTRTPLGGGGRTTTYTDESWVSVDGSRPSRYSYAGRVHDEPPLTGHEVRWPPTEYAQLKRLPTDPDALLRTLRYGDDSGASDQAAYMDVCLLLRGPRVMPPGLQAAAFEALSRLPGVVVDADEVDALGRHGIGVSYPGQTYGLIFERDTYVYLGLRQEGKRGRKFVEAEGAPELDVRGPDGRKPVAGELTGGTGFVEVKGLVRSAVVDELGRRP